jgi:hypothetical protein
MPQQPCWRRRQRRRRWQFRQEDCEAIDARCTCVALAAAAVWGVRRITEPQHFLPFGGAPDPFCGARNRLKAGWQVTAPGVEAGWDYRETTTGAWPPQTSEIRSGVRERLAIPRNSPSKPSQAPGGDSARLSSGWRLRHSATCAVWAALLPCGRKG